MPHILLVDDNKYLLQAVTRALQTANPQWCITAASTIEEADVALQSLDQEYGRIEVVATDLVIGNDADAGMKVLEASKERDPLIEVILFTSYENALDRRAAFSFGAYDCLSKTIPGISFVEELSVKISKALQHRKIIPVNSQYPIVSSKILSSRALTIFLCHSSSDKPAVRELYRRLRTENISPWLDEENLLPGQDWDREIAKAVRVTDIVIVCLSRSSVTKAGYVQREIKYALDVADEQPEGTIFLIPLKLEECNIPERLRRWHWVNYFEESGYQRLMRSLRSRAETLGITVAPEIEPS